jgi:hypothetical protein
MLLNFSKMKVFFDRVREIYVARGQIDRVALAQIFVDFGADVSAAATVAADIFSAVHVAVPLARGTPTPNRSRNVTPLSSRSPTLIRAAEHAADGEQHGEGVSAQDSVCTLPAAPAAVPAARSPVSSTSTTRGECAASVADSLENDVVPFLRFHEFFVALAMGALLRHTPAVVTSRAGAVTASLIAALPAVGDAGAGAGASPPPDGAAAAATPAAAAPAETVGSALDCCLELWSFFDLNADGQIEKSEVWSLLEREKKRLSHVQGHGGRRASVEGAADVPILSRERWEEVKGASGAVQFREFTLALTKWFEDEDALTPEK